MSEVASGVSLQKAAAERPTPSDVTTLVELFRRAVSRERNLLNYKKDGHWRQVSSREMESQVRAVAMGLHALDVRAGDRVGILSENRIEWTIADLGVINCGALDAPIYATQAPKQVAYILNDAGVEVLFISNQAQYDRVRDALDSCPKLRVIISFDPIVAPSRPESHELRRSSGAGARGGRGGAGALRDAAGERDAGEPGDC